MKNASAAGAWVLAMVGMASVVYGLYRGIALGQSAIPLVPIGAVFAALGLWMAFRGKP